MVPFGVSCAGGCVIPHRKSWRGHGGRHSDSPVGTGKGNAADGTIGQALGYGWVRLDTQSRFVVQQGFSGGGLWSPDYDAVIAIVGEADADGNGQAVTVHHADRFLPAERFCCWPDGACGPAMRSPSARGAGGGPWSMIRRRTGTGGPVPAGSCPQRRPGSGSAAVRPRCARSSPGWTSPLRTG